MPFFHSEGQERALKKASAGKSIFISGPAGCGKSHILQEIITRAEWKYPNGVFVTASTGIAASAIEGRTIHSFAGLGIEALSTKAWAASIRKRPDVLQRWLEAKVLIIDEISMLSIEMFELLEHLARTLRGEPLKPFGGIQLILSGDFYQLPPVHKLAEGDKARFCFQSPKWDKCVQETIIMDDVFRQADSKTVEYLNLLREGTVHPDFQKLLDTKTVVCFTHEPEEPVQAVTLYSHNHNVDQENRTKFAELVAKSEEEKGERPKIVTYRANDWILEKDPAKRLKYRAILEKMVVQDKLGLCVGAQVMLLKNKPEFDLCNGSLGVVVGFGGARDLPVVLFSSGTEIEIAEETFQVKEGKRTLASRTAVPLRLAYALSVHKAQGMSIDKLHVDLGGVFEDGMVYVALSRAKDIEKLQVKGFEAKNVTVNPDVRAFYDKFKKKPEEKEKTYRDDF